jgi:hypothetical protein
MDRTTGGEGKLFGPIPQVMVQRQGKVDQRLTMTAYKLTRLRTLAQLRPESVR